MKNHLLNGDIVRFDVESNELLIATESYNDDYHIVLLDITTPKRESYRDENIVFVVATKAQKNVNEEALIYTFLNDKNFGDIQRKLMNGRIQYFINAGVLKSRTYSFQVMYFKNNVHSLESEKITFEVKNEKTPEKGNNNPMEGII